MVLGCGPRRPRIGPARGPPRMNHASEKKLVEFWPPCPVGFGAVKRQCGCQRRHDGERVCGPCGKSPNGSSSSLAHQTVADSTATEGNHVDLLRNRPSGLLNTALASVELELIAQSTPGPLGRIAVPCLSRTAHCRVQAWPVDEVNLDLDAHLSTWWTASHQSLAPPHRRKDHEKGLQKPWLILRPRTML